ncbi:MAG: flavin reductase family protein [Anaerolineae bacterium]|nr:flavin reductase family protein [Anaerolineae bacterium]
MKKRLGPTTDLMPMPALLVAVRTGEDEANVLTVAWAGIVGGQPPMMALEIGSGHYSTPFIEREGNFTVNVPASTQVVGVDYCGMVSGREDPTKAATCGWTFLPSTKISSPLIAECPLNFECQVVRKVEASQGAFYLVEILETHVDEKVLKENKIDALLVDPLIFTPDGKYYRLGECLGKAWDVGKVLKK